jgi:hypothetical protein
LNTANPQLVFREGREGEEKRAPLWQDKGTPRRTDPASPEPSYIPKTAQSEPKHHGSQKRQLREVSGCITDDTFQRLETMRDAGKKTEKSRSFYVGKFITQGVQRNGDLTYVSSIEPFIEGVMDRKLNQFFNRFLGLTARNTHDLSMIMPLLIGFFGKYLTPDVLHQIEVDADTAARVNMTGLTPQVKETMQAIKRSWEAAK